MNKIATRLTVAGILLFCGVGGADELHVPSEYLTIQAALDAARGGDEVIIADGTYTGEGNHDLYFLYLPSGAVTVRSQSGPDNCIIDCKATQADPHVGFFARSRVTLVGLTIINGYGMGLYGYDHTGGAILCYGNGGPRIINCIFRDNSAEQGGAIYCYPNTNVTIANCTFSNNSAGQAGGAIYADQATVALFDCTINRNSAEEHGGGICSTEATLNLVDCTVRCNSANAGGGLYCDAGTSATINNCAVIANSATGVRWPWGGGGIYCTEANISIIDTLISLNLAGAEGQGDRFRGGGGIHSVNTSLTITNSNITANRVRGDYSFSQGGGIYFRGLYSSDDKAASFTIRNSTIAGNSAAYGSAVHSTESYPVITGCVITRNSSNDRRYGRGGAAIVSIKDDAGSIISNCTVVGNFPSGFGGMRESHVITNSILYHNGDDERHPTQVEGATIKYSNVQGGYGGEGNIDADPCFIDLGTGYWDPNGTPKDRSDDFWVWTEGDYHLLPTSPCIDGGDNGYFLSATDLDGDPRIMGRKIDMGAYEYIPPVEVEVTLVPQTINCNSKGKLLKAHILLPDAISADEVDVSTPAVAEPVGVESQYIKVLATSPVRLEIAFDRRAFCEPLTETGELEVTVTGSLTTGQYFYASDTIRIRPNRRPIIRKLLKIGLNKPHSSKSL
jgi:predicted outer membrane repeat protein